MLANLDAEIAQIDRALAAAGGVIAPETATPEDERQRSHEPARALRQQRRWKALLAIAKDPRMSRWAT